MSQPVRRLLSIGVGLAVSFLLAFGGFSFAQPDEGEPGVFRNPLNAYAGDDPWLQYYEGNYYLMASTWASELTLRTAPTLAGLKTAMPVQINAETDPSRCCTMWAPEFHLLDGPDAPHWYVYYTAGTSGTQANQRTHVLESAGTDPRGPYTYKGRLYDPQNDVWTIDGSIVKIDQAHYFFPHGWAITSRCLSRP